MWGGSVHGAAEPVDLIGDVTRTRTRMTRTRTTTNTPGGVGGAVFPPGNVPEIARKNQN